MLEALGTTLDEGVAMVADSIEFLEAHGLEVLFDAEHFFDGYKRNPEFACGCSRARRRRAPTASCCATPTAARCPHEVERIVARGRRLLRPDDVGIGVHLHDDTGCGVANALAGVRGGATQVQGTINGYGERTGNCNLTTIIPNLTLKMGIETIPADRLERLTPVAHHVAELVNMALNPQAPYVGTSAFAHKAGLHVSAIAKRPDAYEHVVPDSVGNGTRFVVSELAGKSTLMLKAKELGLELDGPPLSEVVDTLKRLEHEGYHFEVADASLELLMRRAAGWRAGLLPGRESFRVITDDLDRRRRRPVASPPRRRSRCTSAASALIATAEGNGPVNALDQALRDAIGGALPGARPGAPHRLQGAGARHRRRAPARSPGCCSTPPTASDWTTIGVCENIIEASLAGARRLDRLRLAPEPRQRELALQPCRPIRSFPPRSTRTSPGAEPRARVHMPPARSWRADRPGDLGAVQPKGALLGSPGPNVGYALTLANRVRDRMRLEPHEEADDATR